MTALSRRALLTAGALTGVSVLSACTSDPATPPGTGTNPGSDPDAGDDETAPEPPAAVVTPLTESTTLFGNDAELAAGMSALLLASSPVAVLTTGAEDELSAAAALAAAGHWPVLIGSADGELPEATTTELQRLGVEHAILVMPAAPAATATATDGATDIDSDTESDTDSETDAAPNPPTATPTELAGFPDVHLHIVEASANPAVPEEVPVGTPPESLTAALVSPPESGAGAAMATAAALGAATHADIEDPRENADVMAALREDQDQPLVTLGSDESSAGTLMVTATMAQSAPELPGGGVTVFPHRRLIALYGHPGVPVLGLLGEQNIQASVERVNGYVEQYSALVDETVVPAWEIIATVATGGAGDDGNYSKVWEPELFRPWVDAAKDAGVYVVLDLQPGRSDFLTQAKEYEELLIEPNVGLALDPEWRLGPNERHLVRIGSVEAEEINAVSDYLASLVREHNLPQKVLTLHQFRLSMIQNRDQVRTDHPELAIVLHADGQGSQGAKQDTWRVLKQDLPEGMWLGWKNFYDEDSPMLTPEQTVAQVDPIPWFVSYQ